MTPFTSFLCAVIVFVLVGLLCFVSPGISLMDLAIDAIGLILVAGAGVLVFAALIVK